jgi:hypothetical protein
MISRQEKMLVVALGGGLLVLGIMNALFRVSSRNNLPVFSMETIIAGWPYWVGMASGLIGGIGYWAHTANRKNKNK